jgi:hypothetical protein
MLNRLEGLFKSLKEHDVRYLVIGEIAAVLHGIPRATFYQDILVEATEDNADRLLAALLDAGLATATLSTREELLAHEITVFKDRVRVDVQTSTPGITFEEAWARRETKNFRATTIQVVTRQDLIASKLATGRPVDLEDARLLQSQCRRRTRRV